MKMRDLITIVEGRIFEALEPTSKYNSKIKEFLANEGIKTYEFDDFITVDRTSMVQYAKGLEENEAYSYVMELIKEILPENLYVTWGGRNDDWMGVDVYERNYSS